MRPFSATACRLRSISSPPTTSRIVSNPSGTAAIARPSHAAGDRSSTRSAPSDTTQVHLAGRTRDGDARPDRPWRSEYRRCRHPRRRRARAPSDPDVSPPCTTSASHAVRNTSGIAARVGDPDQLPGRAINWRSCVGDLFGVRPTGLDAHHLDRRTSTSSRARPPHAPCRRTPDQESPAPQAGGSGYMPIDLQQVGAIQRRCARHVRPRLSGPRPDRAPPRSSASQDHHVNEGRRRASRQSPIPDMAGLRFGDDSNLAGDRIDVDRCTVGDARSTRRVPRPPQESRVRGLGRQHDSAARPRPSRWRRPSVSTELYARRRARNHQHVAAARSAIDRLLGRIGPAGAAAERCDHRRRLPARPPVERSPLMPSCSTTICTMRTPSAKAFGNSSSGGARFRAHRGCIGAASAARPGGGPAGGRARLRLDPRRRWWSARSRAGSSSSASAGRCRCPAAAIRRPTSSIANRSSPRGHSAVVGPLSSRRFIAERASSNLKSKSSRLAAGTRDRMQLDPVPQPIANQTRSPVQDRRQHDIRASRPMSRRRCRSD